jgi:hypothetical protein
LLNLREFHRTYNQTLHDWRQHRRLRNPANPFPNLQHQDDLYELPWWRLDLSTGQRHAVWGRPASDGVEILVDGAVCAEVHTVQPIDFFGSANHSLLVPRGALITVVFRLLCCDLFVHGLGGHSYDLYTDQLVRRYFGFEPPSFGVASASRYLFDREREQLTRLDQLQARQRELVHHAESYLGQGWFSDELERRLRPMVGRKYQLVDQLKTNRQLSVSAATEGRELQQLQENIKGLVADDFAERLRPIATLSPAARTAIQSRVYPWFFFGWAGEC